MGTNLYLYAMVRVDAEASNDVVIDIFTICSHVAFALIDLGSNYSYMSPHLTSCLERYYSPRQAFFCLKSSGGVSLWMRLWGLSTDQRHREWLNCIAYGRPQCYSVYEYGGIMSYNTWLPLHGFEVWYSRKPHVEVELPRIHSGSEEQLVKLLELWNCIVSITQDKNHIFHEGAQDDQSGFLILYNYSSWNPGDDTIQRCFQTIYQTNLSERKELWVLL